MTSPRFTAFSQQHPAPEFDHPAPARQVCGQPLRTTWPHFTSTAADMHCGVWACAPGMWRIQFSAHKDEFFCVIEGHVRLHHQDGEQHDIRAGEAGVIPAGFVGMFEVVSAVRKYFVVVERPQA